jgi:hypothetical protein
MCATFTSTLVGKSLTRNKGYKPILRFKGVETQRTKHHNNLNSYRYSLIWLLLIKEHSKAFFDHPNPPVPWPQIVYLSLVIFHDLDPIYDGENPGRKIARKIHSFRHHSAIYLECEFGNIQGTYLRSVL